MKQSLITEPVMGEVRVEVKLTNLFDWEKAEEGKLKPDRVRVVTADAMVDTGAVRSAVPPHVVRLLGLTPRRTQVVEYADGRKEAVNLTGPVVVELEGRSTLEDALVLGDEVLIGQTVLEKLDLFVDCQRRRLVPNPAHPDQAVTKVKRAEI